MTRNDLYCMAFRYKKTGIWKKLWDSEVFAIKLKNDEFGYISIMGKNGEYNALGLYIGETGFGSYRMLASMEGPTGNPFKNHELMLKQKSLQAALENKDYLMPEEINEVKEYAKKNDIRLSGKNAYPQFIKYEPGYHPWKVQTKEDTDALYEAMQAACLLAEELKTRTAEELGIFPITPYTKKVPLFEVKDSRIVEAGLAPLPGDPEVHYDFVKADNQVALASVRKLPKKGIWESEQIFMMDPVQNSPEEVPHYPMLLLVVESKSFHVLPVSLVDHAERNQQKVLEEFVNAWNNLGCCPKEIRCRDERTYALLKDFCEKSDVKISVYKKRMPALDDAEMSLLEYSSGVDDEEIAYQIEDAINDILSMSKTEIKMMPKQLLKELGYMIEHNFFPKDIADALLKKLK